MHPCAPVTASLLHAVCFPRAAKNVALAGVKSLTIHDDQPTVLADLTTQVLNQPSRPTSPCLDLARFAQTRPASPQARPSPVSPSP